MDRDIAIFQCTFQAYVERATVLIKFPCIFFLQWKTANGKRGAEGKCRPTSINSQVNFQQTLQLCTQLVFDNANKQFIKKQTMVNLNLVSKSRQDQIKLVGRVSVDLAQIANNGQFEQLRTYKLAYCSVDGEITFSAVMKSKKLTNLNPQDLDKSSFNQYISFYSCQNGKQVKNRKDCREEGDQQTSIGYGRKTFQNAIDIPEIDIKNHNKFNQSFFVMPSPRQNALFNRTGEIPKMNRQKSVQAQTVLSSPHTEDVLKFNVLGKDFGKNGAIMKDNELYWQQDKTKFRDEIDKNRYKIQDLEKKILQLCVNLQDSRRHIQLTERQNRQKQQIIKKLKSSVHQQANQQQNIQNQLQIQYDKVVKERKIAEEGFRKQIFQNQQNLQNLKRQTEELRRMWNEKKQHYEQKLTNCESFLRQKQKKINQLCIKIDQLTKYKYQYDLLKQLSDEKQSKIKLVQRELIKLSRQLQEIKNNNLAEQNYKIKINYNQSLKNLDQLTQKYTKCEQEVSKYRQNYIKIQTAYQIQTKNYQNTRQKYNQIEINFFALQKQNIQHRNSWLLAQKQCEEVQKKYFQISANHNKLINDLQNAQKLTQTTRSQLKSMSEQNNNLKTAFDKLKLQQQTRSLDYENSIKRVESSFTSSLEHKDIAINSLKQEMQIKVKGFQQQIASKQTEFESRKTALESQIAKLTMELNVKGQQLQKKIANIKILQQTVFDKQQIIKLFKQENQGLKQANNQLNESLSKMQITEHQLYQNIAILEEQSQKILYILQQKEQTDRELEQLTQRYTKQKQQLQNCKSQLIESVSRNNQLQEKNQQGLKIIQERQALLAEKQYQLRNLSQNLDEQKSELIESNKQIDKLNDIIKQINQRYEQHVKIQQRYVQEINSIRSQKEEIQVVMNKNSNDLISHNNDLEIKIQSLQQQVEKLENYISTIEEEKKHLQNVFHQNSKTDIQSKFKHQQFQTKINKLQNQIVIRSNNLFQRQKQLQQAKKQLKILFDKISVMDSQIYTLKQQIQSKNNQANNLYNRNIQIQKLFQQSTYQKNLLQRKISELQEQILYIKESISNSNTPMGAEIIQSQLIFDGQQRLSKREQDLQQLLLQSDRKNEGLEAKISNLLTQMQEMSRQQRSQGFSPNLYSSFTQFQHQQMSKIISQQREEIDRQERQLRKYSNVDPSALERRIQELVNHIAQLQSSFKLQMERILGEQSKQDSINNGGLMVINEQMNEDDMYKSEKSLPNSPSRIKSSVQMAQFVQLKQKFTHLQQQKNRLQQQFCVVEQQKFNLLSTINEKSIQIEDIINSMTRLQSQNDQIKIINQNINKKLRYLENQLENTKNQITFGSSINFSPNEHSVTRSEPVRSIQDLRLFQNKDVQIQNLKVDLERLKNRQQELLWNVKDLQMQLQAVTQNLNILNASNMNSVLHSTPKITLQEQSSQQIRQIRLFQPQQGYSKEKLLLNLKRNQQLKQLSHSLIRSLKQRQKDSKEQQILIKNIQYGHEQMRNSLNNSIQSNVYEICQKVKGLLLQFQSIKVYVMRNEGSRLKQEAEKIIGQIKSIDIMKNILSFEESLKQIKQISEGDAQLQSR